MLKGTVTRKGKWTTIPKPNKAAAHRGICTCCHLNYGYLHMLAKRAVVRVAEHIDHIFPRRWIEEEYPKVDPHQPENLCSICNICHGKKKIAEDALYRGDAFEFIRILKGMRYPMKRVFDMAHRLGIRELEGWSATNNPLQAVTPERAREEFLKLTEGM
jgi:hypothetical protein